MKTDLYRNVSRNTSTPSRIETMEAAGLLIIEDRGRAVLLTLTENGYAVAKLFREAEDILSSSQNGC